MWEETILREIIQRNFSHKCTWLHAHTQTRMLWPKFMNSKNRETILKAFRQKQHVLGFFTKETQLGCP